MTRHAFAIAATALGLFVAGSASAQSADAIGTTGINGFVTARCGFTTPDVTLNIGEMSHTSGGQIATLDPTTLTSRTATLTGSCNGASATMTVQAFPMLNTSFAGTPPSGFETRVDFVATAAEGAVTASGDSTSPNPGSPSSATTFTSDITVSFSNAHTNQSTDKLVAGPYTGSVNVVLTPAT